MAHTPEEKRAARRRKQALQNEDNRLGKVHGPMIVHHKPRKVRQIIDQDAVMPAARMFMNGIISASEMMAMITLATAKGEGE
jgi:hypothetical protein